MKKKLFLDTLREIGEAFRLLRHLKNYVEERFKCAQGSIKKIMIITKWSRGLQSRKIPTETSIFGLIMYLG